MSCGRSQPLTRWLLTSSISWIVVLAGCSDQSAAPTAPGGEAQLAKVAGPLKVTPPQLKFTALGATATLNAASSVAGTITVSVSTPPCVSVSPRAVPKNQAKFTVTATAPGTCAMTVTDGGGNTVQVPVTVTGTIPLLPQTLVSGGDHTCGLTSAGVAYCWGDNSDGQLGNSTNLLTTNPNPSPTAVDGNLTFVTLAAGEDHTCGLTSGGAAYCWGANDWGQLGITTVGGRSSPTPNAVGGSLTFITLTAGNVHTCGLTATGTAYCWGGNDDGQLGTTTNNGVFAANPTPEAVSGNLTFATIVAGGHHTCGLTSAGDAQCWGLNNLGQLGTTTNNGTVNANPTPAAVSGTLAFVALTAGHQHTCGLTAAGAAYCWGANDLGQLGSTTNSGTFNANPTPEAVAGNLTFTAVAASNAGGVHTCGLTRAGVAYCWGDNASGELGTTTNNGTGNANPQPTAVTGNLTFVALSPGDSHTCGLTGAGVAYCWGGNFWGQLGTTTNNGTNDANPTPEAVSGNLTFALP